MSVLPDGYEAPLASADKIALNYDGNNLLYSVAIGLLRSVKELRYEIVDKYTRQSYFNGYAIDKFTAEKMSKYQALLGGF